MRKLVIIALVFECVGDNTLGLAVADERSTRVSLQQK